MGETFRPILPWMRGRIGADVILPPALRRAVFVMALQGLRVVFALVAEERAKGGQIARAPQQNIPIMMADLVTEMAHQRAIGFLHLRAPRFALGVIGFGYIERDFAFVVP